MCNNTLFKKGTNSGKNKRHNDQKTIGFLMAWLQGKTSITAEATVCTCFTK